MQDLEAIRAYVDGTLPPEERRAFVRRLGDEPELAELAEVYGVIVAATSEPVPASTASFDEVSARFGRPRLRRRWLVAAALLLATGAALWLGDMPRDVAPTTVVLSTLPLRELPKPPAAPDWPRDLLTHRTADFDGLRWYRDLDKALEVARAASRPVFLFVDYPGCPLCRDFRLDQCRDEKVIAAADRFVLANVAWTDAPMALRTDPTEGWPIFAILDHEGERRDGFYGIRTAASLATWLERAAKVQGETGDYEFHDWTALRNAALRLELAASERDPAKRHALLLEVARAPGDLLPRAGRARLAAMEFDAQQALFAARDLGDPAAALDLLRGALERLAGTPFGDDLARVAEFVETHGAFPRLETNP